MNITGVCMAHPGFLQKNLSRRSRDRRLKINIFSVSIGGASHTGLRRCGKAENYMDMNA